MKINRYSPAVQALLAALLFGMSTPLAKLLLGEMDSVILAGLLYLGSGLGAVIVLLIGRSRSAPGTAEAHITRPDVPWLAGAVLSGGVAAPIVLLLGLRNTPAATASLLLNIEGVATTVMAALIFKEAVGRRIWTAMLLVIAASVLLSWDSHGGWGFSPGTLGILGACIFWGLDNNLTRNVSAKNPMEIVTIKGLSAGTFSLVLGFILGRPAPGLIQILWAMLLGVACYGLSIVFFIRAMRGLGSARTSTFFATAPFIGMLLSIIIFRGMPSGLFYASIPLMLVGTWLMLSEAHAHQHFHAPILHDHRHSHPDEHHIHAHPGADEMEGTHSHLHEHAPIEHSHTHSPDLHHRHGHQS